MSNEIYNPLDKLRLGESVAKALLARPISNLPPSESFGGAGIYALYYTGKFAPYRKIAEKNVDGQWAAPIYVGKAVPPGARKGGIKSLMALAIMTPVQVAITNKDLPGT